MIKMNSYLVYSVFCAVELLFFDVDPFALTVPFGCSRRRSSVNVSEMELSKKLRNSWASYKGKQLFIVNVLLITHLLNKVVKEFWKKRKAR